MQGHYWRGAIMSPLKKEADRLEEAAAKLMQQALKNGAERVEVCGGFQEKTTVSLEKQDFHLVSSDHGYGLGVRVLCGQKQGFASGNSLEASELKLMASQAVTIAKLSPENPHQTIAKTENISLNCPKPTLDPQFRGLSLQTQKDWTKYLKESACKDERFRINEGSVSIQTSNFLVLNSLGTHQIESESMASWTMMGMGVEGDNITSFDYFGEMARTAKEVPKRIVHSTEKFCELVLQCLKSGPAQSYKGLVVLTPRAVIDILLSALTYHLNGRTVVEKISRWNLDDKGKSIAAEGFTLWDKPWLVDRYGWSSFDREGTPTANRKLIDKGKIENFLFDQYAAKALNTQSTGNAMGGSSSIPTVGTYCLCVEGGSEVTLDLLEKVTHQQKDFLVVNRFSGNTDPITGDFSGVAKGADWWHSGERVYSVQETLISGNVFEAFESGIFGISKEVEIVDSAEESPTIVLDGISVTAG